LDRPIDGYASEDDEWGAELFEVGGPEEPSATERRTDRNSVHYNAEDVISDPQTREALTLLAMAITRLGGVLVLTNEELSEGYKFAFDIEYSRKNGGVRIYSWKDEAE